ncbi:cation-binding protein [Caulobacter sp. Root1455]|uniref:hemerythrin domain-containing protein n=1 Tax=unclassified Caulobacter TaxID=2648921 RepID=UPI0006F3FB63|nr:MULTISPECIES: hemerythrin domain-containing protein [unclassified Caulobacter]KQY26468.1 cation-binding protein [Caulobacter sp. Root487D2Y]KQY91447.1 cation-binding protein [Caulobacter sp. Root1455]
MTTSTIESIPPRLLAEPIEWFFAEHYRHRQACKMIEEVAAAMVFDRPRVIELIVFLDQDLPLHVIDEEEDFFPLLRRRCEPGDDVERVLGMLSAEHRADVVQASAVRDHLLACLETERAPGLDATQRKAMIAFAAQERRHLGLENAIVLPIARLRLAPEDLTTLGRRLAARRGRLLDVAVGADQA